MHASLKPIDRSDIVAAVRVLRDMHGKDFDNYAIACGAAVILHIAKRMERAGDADSSLVNFYNRRKAKDIDVVVGKDYEVKVGATDGSWGRTIDGGIEWKIKRFIAHPNNKGEKKLVADIIEIRNSASGNSFIMDLYSEKGRGPKINSIGIKEMLQEKEGVEIDGERIAIVKAGHILAVKTNIPDKDKREQDRIDIVVLNEIVRGEDALAVIA